MRRSKSKIALVLLLGVMPTALTACQKKPTEQELMASSALKVSQSKASSYSSYIAVQAKMPAISLKSFRQVYNDLLNENDGINHNKESGIYHDGVDSALFRLQGIMKNKYTSKQTIKDTYQDVRNQLDSTSSNIEKRISDLKQYRDNSIIKKVIRYYNMELELIKMDRIYAKSIYKQDSDLDNSPGIELYKPKMDKLYRQIIKEMLPIIQQANYEEQSAQYHSRKESQYNNELSNDFSKNNTLTHSDSITGSSSDQIANDNKTTAANNLNKYNAQIPSDKGK